MHWSMEAYAADCNMIMLLLASMMLTMKQSISESFMLALFDLCVHEIFQRCSQVLFTGSIYLITVRNIVLITCSDNLDQDLVHSFL